MTKDLPEPSAQWTEEDRRNAILLIHEEMNPPDGSEPDFNLEKARKVGERIRLILTQSAGFLEANRATVLKGHP